MSSSDRIENVLHETRKFPPPAGFAEQANISSEAEYQEMWQRAKDKPAEFWGEMAENLTWFKKYDKVMDGQMPETKWFLGGKINASYQCLDRHLNDLAEEQSRDHLGRRAGRHPRPNLSGFAPRSLQIRQRAENAWGSRPATASRSTCR